MLEGVTGVTSRMMPDEPCPEAVNGPPGAALFGSISATLTAQEPHEIIDSFGSGPDAGCGASDAGKRRSCQEAHVHHLPRGQGHEEDRSDVRRSGQEVRGSKGCGSQARRQGKKRRAGRLGPGADAAKR